MKKLLLVLALIATGGMLFTSCKSAHSCPAYSKVQPAPAQRPA